MKPHLQKLFDDWKRRRWAAFEAALGIRPPRTSKYRRKPGEGKCVLGKDSSVRKVARAIARGKLMVPEVVLQSAQERRMWYMHGTARANLMIDEMLKAAA